MYCFYSSVFNKSEIIGNALASFFLKKALTDKWSFAISTWSFIQNVHSCESYLHYLYKFAQLCQPLH